jgi:hypothetical protein
MTELPEIIKRATGLTGAIAGDLSLFGGILRCNTCGTEVPVGDIGRNLRTGWPECHGQAMTWVTLKLLAAETREVPDGYELAAVPSVDWRLKSGKTCRQPACRNTSVAELNRRRRMSGGVKRDSWWAYCLDHLYANWIENGQFWHWILREKGADA